MTQPDAALLSRALDYQDLAAMRYRRIERAREKSLPPWVIEIEQSLYADLAAEARYCLLRLIEDGPVRASPTPANTPCT